MKVTFSRYVKRGVERGGEDLFLQVKLTTYNLDDEGLDAAIEEALDGLPESQEEAEADDDCDNWLDIWFDGKFLQCESSPDYGIEMNLPKEKAVEFVRRVCKEGDWLQRVSTGEYFVIDNLFIDGNAELGELCSSEETPDGLSVRPAPAVRFLRSNDLVDGPDELRELVRS